MSADREWAEECQRLTEELAHAKQAIAAIRSYADHAPVSAAAIDNVLAGYGL